MDPSKINERIEKIMNHYLMSKQEFCKKIWISETDLDEILITQDLPAFKLSRRICSDFPQISFTWLLLGNGNFLSSPDLKKQSSSQSKVNNKQSFSLTEKKTIDVINEMPLDFGISAFCEIDEMNFMDSRKMVKRIEKIMMFFSMSTEKFSEKTKIEQNTLNYIIEGKNKVTLDEIQLICFSFPQLNPRWLILGEGVLVQTDRNEKLNNEELKITIRLAEEIYNLVIKREDEAYYRLAAKNMKESIKMYGIVHSEFTTERILKVMGYHYALKYAEIKCFKDSIKFKNFRDKHYYTDAVGFLREKYDYYKVIYSDISQQKLFGLVAYHFAFKYVMMKIND